MPCHMIRIAVCGVSRRRSWLRPRSAAATFPMLIGAAALTEAPFAQAMALEEKTRAVFSAFRALTLRPPAASPGQVAWRMISGGNRYPE
jgi:hypothetical protein